MTLNELILKLQEHQELCGEYECSISIDTADAFNITTCTEVDVVFTNIGERKVAFCGSLETSYLESLEEDES